MPDNNNEIIYIDDDSEFMQENSDTAIPAGIDDSPVLPDGHRPKAALIRLAENSKMSPNQCLAFLASVELDLLRSPDERLNLESLYRACCVKGNRSWLNPAAYIRRIDAILEKYLCSGVERRLVLAPIITLLSDIANEGINPSAFLEYIILPRLETDYDWRRWSENYLGALIKIAAMLISLRQAPPFNRESLGNGDIRLVRDIVLVKYAGKPLSRFSPDELEDGDLLERYRNAWQRLEIDNPFTILFMKTNILHFMYTMSGRIDLVQLVMIIESMPDIERGFRENFPARWFRLDINTLKISLYNYDMARSVYERKKRGFSSYDFVIELRAYLSIIIALLGTGSGIYLCSYYASKLAALKSPGKARLLERLIRVIRDDGGMHIYTWHTRRLLSLPGEMQERYIDMIEANGGTDPSYPATERFFDSAVHGAFDTSSFNRRLEILGISIDDFDQSVSDELKNDGKRYFTVPHGAWISAYIRHYPERKIEIDSFRSEVIEGRDIKWDKARVMEIDSLGVPLHESLIHSVIPGLSGSVNRKSSSFQELMLLYGTVTETEPVEVSHEFSIPVQGAGSFDKFLNARIRSQVNMIIIKQVWSCIEDPQDVNPGNVLFFINKEYLKLRESSDSRGKELIETGEILGGMPDGPEKDDIDKKYRSLEKASKHIKGQLELYESILREIDSMNDNEKIVTCIIVAGKQAEPGSEFAMYVLHLLIKSLSYDVTLSGRLDTLTSDIAIDLIHLRQLEMLVETLDSMARLAVSDGNFAKAIDTMTARNNDIEKLLSPFILLKRKRLTMEAVDAAVRHVTGFAKITAEREKWQQLMESCGKKDSRFFEPYRVYASRSIMDAYYGDMGSICLSALPDAIKDPGLQVIRLASLDEKKIKGIALMYRAGNGLSSYLKRRGDFWHSFAFNPIPSMLSKMTKRQQLYLYLNYRMAIENVSKDTGLPVVLSGINGYGITSNDWSFSDLIITFEKKFKGIEVNDATGLSLFYPEESYREAMVIIDPAKGETFLAERLLENFYGKLEDTLRPS